MMKDSAVVTSWIAITLQRAIGATDTAIEDIFWGVVESKLHRGSPLLYNTAGAPLQDALEDILSDV